MAHVSTRTCGILVATCLIAATSGAGAGQEDQRTMSVRDRRVVLDTGDSLLGPCVLKSADGYRMWYTAVARPKKDDPLLRECPWLAEVGHIWETRYATSADGMTWTTRGTVMRPGRCGSMKLTQVLMPTLLEDEGTLHMWLTVREFDTNLYRIAYSRSSDGIAWTEPVLALDLGPAGQPDDRNITSCCVLKEDDRFRMWYGGQSAADGKMRTLYAESTDGVSWARHGVSVDTGPEGSGDARRAYRPCVTQQGEGYVMLYTGIADDSLQGPYVVMAATSEDGLSWSKHGVLMDTGQPGTPGQLRVYDPWLLKDDNGQWRIWYIGKGTDGVRRICHAWWDGIVK